ncbi:hypothetical protein SAMN05421796_109139 [Chryseobacterium piscicola]|uniref:Uncharacterized protein n=1 Tax=Chryseobacterium piscicola TaxID=551459 RepID=A0A1N7NWJ7_9FLAO|nr:hypothetical protein SAMN05421796_109139 [Chryseobacterium piscicola]
MKLLLKEFKLILFKTKQFQVIKKNVIINL